MRRTAAALIATAALASSLLGCASTDDAGSGASTSPTRTSDAVRGTITVFAAASLQEAFTTIGEQFRAAHPGSKVVFNFGPSSGLAEQIGQGAPADVFASASAKTMDLVVAGGGAAGPTTFATNTMEIAVPSDNPAHIATVADLARKGVKVALCQAAVPCGTTALKVFTNANVTVTPVTEEVDVKSTLSKVRLGEVDAGVVYVTDVKAAGSTVLGVPIPAAINASTAYPIAPLTASTHAALAKAFVDYVLSADGARALTAAGFSTP